MIQEHTSVAFAPATASPGLHVVYGSRTRRGLSHPNEDRHAVSTWTHWNNDAHLEGEGDETNSDRRSKGGTYPIPTVEAPICIGSARKDTTISGSGATGGARDPFGKSEGDPPAGQANTTSTKDNDPINTDSNAFLWTVCDGHDGPEAADFVCKHVGNTFSSTWHLTASHKLPPALMKDKKLEDIKTYARGYSLSNALARTFESLDAAFRVHVTPPEGSQTKVPGSTAGSCVTSIFLSGNLMCCAGLGDCKAAILTLEEVDSGAGAPDSGNVSTSHTTPTDKPTPSAVKAPQQQFQVTWFSKEHRSTCPKERARIRARGGWFRLHRVGGVLEPTRTIGDFDVKASQPPGVVIATPEVRTFTVSKPALVLIASDGVWDVMDASQLLRTLKKRRRLWRGVLSWLGASMPEKRSLLTFGFRRRAKSKEGLESMLQLPTGGDLVAMAETIVTRAHDLGSDDDCTCLCIYLRPGECASVPTSSSAAAGDSREDDIDEMEEEIDEDEDEELELELDMEDEDEEAGAVSDWPDSSYEYEKWHKPDGSDIPQAEEDDEEEQPLAGPSEDKDTDEWASNIFLGHAPTDTVFYSPNVEDPQDPPQVAEKARKRSEERRLAREKRRRSLEEGGK